MRITNLSQLFSALEKFLTLTFKIIHFHCEKTHEIHEIAPKLIY